MQSVCVLGLGYIGLPTATTLANAGWRVFGVDNNPAVIEALEGGQSHISEPGLQDHIESAVSKGNLQVGCEPTSADVFIIAVPTPFYVGEKTPNISFVIEAVQSIARVLKPGNLVVLESTCPVGTTERVAELLSKLRPDLNLPCDEESENDLFLAYCPERVLPGKILEEIINNDRLIGGVTTKCSQKGAALYQSFVSGECLLTDAKTAELAKLVENSFRDVNIAFANQISLIADDLGVDVWELIELVNHHPRVNVLQPGTGVGGHCIAVDPWFIVSSKSDHVELIETARRVNDQKPMWVASRIHDWVLSFREREGTEPLVGLLGLSFKPNVDDLRESPAINVLNRLLSLNLEVEVAEPNVLSFPGQKLKDYKDVCAKADVIAILVAHDEFRSLEVDAEILDFCGVTKS